jgi:hypothetical protein
MIDILSSLLLTTLITSSDYTQNTSLPSLNQNHSSIAIAASPSTLKTSATRYRLTNLAVLRNAFNNRASNIQVLVMGRVTAVLSDDNNGSRHQRFIVQLQNSQTLLVAHNIDIAPRVSGLRVGDTLYIYGEYEWSEQGGVIHWTHHDPSRRHIDGWIDRNGTIFR